MKTIYDLPDEDVIRRFDLYGALYIFCSQYHSGQGSRGYRILSKLLGPTPEGVPRYRPGLTVQRHQFESEEQRDIHNELVQTYAGLV